MNRTPQSNVTHSTDIEVLTLVRLALRANGYGGR